MHIDCRIINRCVAIFIFEIEICQLWLHSSKIKSCILFRRGYDLLPNVWHLFSALFLENSWVRVTAFGSCCYVRSILEGVVVDPEVIATVLSVQHPKWYWVLFWQVIILWGIWLICAADFFGIWFALRWFRSLVWTTFELQFGVSQGPESIICLEIIASTFHPGILIPNSLLLPHNITGQSTMQNHTPSSRTLRDWASSLISL